MKQLLAALATCLALAAPARATVPVKTLHYAFRIAETGFDPARISDIYSRTATAHIFEALYAFDPLAPPSRSRRCVTRSGTPRPASIRCTCPTSTRAR